jgi:bifunctional non-homologous end joining protein LigD
MNYKICITITILFYTLLPFKLFTQNKNKPIFVIHKHAASHLHYDFRLEVNGILKSWAIPKGISSNPKIKRLAIPTTDHAYEYAKFEGKIPKGEYGAGTVTIWDSGTYKNIRQKNGKIVPMQKCIEERHIEICLKSKKLNGNFALIRSKGPKENWLIFKMKPNQKK